jgi:hypothetical protein
LKENTMNIRVRKTGPALGLALALTLGAGGVALGADEDEGGYTGDNATVPDPDRTSVALTLYGAGGTPVTSGSTTTPIASYAAAAGAVRAGDDHATLFAHLAQSDTAPGAWPGVQVTGTDDFTGAPRVAFAGGYTLADVAAAFPNDETAASFDGVYELRLRTSSPTAGVGTPYAATWVKVTGTTWQVTTAPKLGDEEPEPQPQPVGTSVAVTWPASATYGAGSSVTATVTPASGTTKPTGSVRLLSGSQVLATASLAGGAASLAVPSLTPGTHTLQVAYDGAANAFNPSSSATRTLTVGRATPGRPVLKVVKKPTTKKAGAATVSVATPAGLVAAGGTGQLSLVKGKTVRKVSVSLRSGVATIKLPKLPKGAWKATFVYAGDTYYLGATSATVKVKSKAAKR